MKIQTSAWPNNRRVDVEVDVTLTDAVGGQQLRVWTVSTSEGQIGWLTNDQHGWHAYAANDAYYPAGILPSERHVSHRGRDRWTGEPLSRGEPSRANALTELVATLMSRGAIRVTTAARVPYLSMIATPLPAGGSL